MRASMYWWKRKHLSVYEGITVYVHVKVKCVTAAPNKFIIATRST